MIVRRFMNDGVPSIMLLSLLALTTFPLSSWSYSSSATPYQNFVTLSSTSSTVKPKSTTATAATKTTTNAISQSPNRILCCSMDESISFLVHEAFERKQQRQRHVESCRPSVKPTRKINTTGHFQKHLHQNDCNLVHYVSTSKEALQVLSDYPDDFFSAIIMDDAISSEENGWLFQQCVKRRLIPYRIVVLSSPPPPKALKGSFTSGPSIDDDVATVSTTDEMDENGRTSRTDEEDHQHYQHFYHYAYGADVVVTKPSVAELQRVHQVLVGLEQTNSKNANIQQLQQQEQQFQLLHPLKRLQQRQHILSNLCGGILTDRIRELQSSTKQLSKSFTTSNSDVAKQESLSFATKTLLSMPPTKNSKKRSTATVLRACISDTESSNKHFYVKGRNHVTSRNHVDSNKETMEEYLRIVHISDTHNFHRYMDLPKGDVLIFTGDICGNYYYNRNSPQQNGSLIQQFEDFLNWVRSDHVYPKYDKIVILAGNHDTYLDKDKCRNDDDYERAQRMIYEIVNEPPQRSQQQQGKDTKCAENPSYGQQDLDKQNKVSYLMNSSINYRGISIYGTPVTICRVEAQGRHMLSNGFERTELQRQVCWENIPNDLDILLTHLPPATMPGSNGNDSSCHLLTKTLYGHLDEDEDSEINPSKNAIDRSKLASRSSRQRSRKPPRLHCFGHVHSQFGVTKKGDTIFSNGSQERLLRDDLYGGGTPLIIDLPLRSRTKSSSTTTTASSPRNIEA